MTNTKQVRGFKKNTISFFAVLSDGQSRLTTAEFTFKLKRQAWFKHMTTLSLKKIKQKKVYFFYYHFLLQISYLEA